MVCNCTVTGCAGFANVLIVAACVISCRSVATDIPSAVSWFSTTVFSTSSTSSDSLLVCSIVASGGSCVSMLSVLGKYCPYIGSPPTNLLILLDRNLSTSEAFSGKFSCNLANLTLVVPTKGISFLAICRMFLLDVLFATASKAPFRSPACNAVTALLGSGASRPFTPLPSRYSSPTSRFDPSMPANTASVYSLASAVDSPIALASCISSLRLNTASPPVSSLASSTSLLVDTPSTTSFVGVTAS